MVSDSMSPRSPPQNYCSELQSLVTDNVAAGAAVDTDAGTAAVDSDVVAAAEIVDIDIVVDVAAAAVGIDVAGAGGSSSWYAPDAVAAS